MARIEQAIKGQIGQPAACMIENKGSLSLGIEMLPDYGSLLTTVLLSN
jgi:hypothetical protein